MPEPAVDALFALVAAVCLATVWAAFCASTKTRPTILLPGLVMSVLYGLVTLGFVVRDGMLLAFDAKASSSVEPSDLIIGLLVGYGAAVGAKLLLSRLRRRDRVERREPEQQG